MPSITFWAGVGGGTEQYRCFTPGAALERLGWNVHYGDTPADVVVVQRVLEPDLPERIVDLQRGGAVVVYDIDDWYDGLPGYNPASRSIGAAELQTLHASLTAADLITTTTSELAEGYARFGRIVVLPNYLDPAVWKNRPRQPHSGIHVGWMGSAKWRSADVELLKPWLSRWLERNPDVTFVAAGSDLALFHYLGVEGLICPPHEDHIRPYDHLPAMLAWFDVGLVPLTFNRFNQSKSWCKGMEYNAMGVPAIASASREYRKFIQPGVNGYLVRKDWPSVLDRALDNLDTLREGARRTAERYFIDEHIDKWVAAYASVPQTVG